MNNRESGWSQYYANRFKTPRPEVIEALQYVTIKHDALDLGSGSFIESKYLLSRGFNVTAVDPEEVLLKKTTSFPEHQFQFECSKIEDYQPPKNYFDFICANYSLPWVPKEFLPAVFARIKNSLNDNGVFCFQLFGVDDGWNDSTNESISFFTEDEVMSLVTKFTVISFKETKTTKRGVQSNKKLWHVYSLIVKK